MTNVNVSALELSPNGGATNEGWKIGLISSQAKAAQSDTWTVTNAVEVKVANIINDAAGTVDVPNIAANVIALDSAATGASSGTIVYR